MSQIRCPNCNTLIDIDQVLYQQLESAAKAKLQKEIEEHRQKYRAAMNELKTKEEQLKERQEQLAKEAEQRAKKLLDEELAKERNRLENEIKERLTKEQAAQIEALQKELEEKSQKVAQLYKAQATIEQLKREKEEALHQAKLQAQKELNILLEAERQKIQEQLKLEEEMLRKKIAQEAELKLKEKELQLEQLKKQLDEAKQKAEQASQQLQGEAQELLIEEWLRLQFPHDTIEEVKKGARGGDCIQIVNDPTLAKCGTIYYESKRTKEFQKGWIEKFKADMRKIGADIGVIVTQTMPKELDRMGLVDGVWVCSFEEFKALSQILRHHILQLAFATKSQENRTDKMSLLYNYLTSSEFRMQIEAIVESFTQMQADLEKEKRAMNKIWKQREKQLEKVIESTTSMYGALKGIAGNAIPHIKALELPYDED